MQDRSKEIQQELSRLGEKPLGASDGSGKWDYEPGDQLAGQVVEADPEWEGKWGAVPRLRIRVDFATESGGTLIDKGEIRSLICSAGRLKDFFELEQPQVGDLVLLHFAGEVPSKTGGKPWADFRAKVHRRVEPTELEQQDESRQGEESPFVPDEAS